MINQHKLTYFRDPSVGCERKIKEKRGKKTFVKEEDERKSMW